MNIERLKRYGIIPRIISLVNPSYSTCGVCGLPWNHCKSHGVAYDKRSGFFAVCEYCYKNATPLQLAKAYQDLYDYWLSISPEIPYKRKEYTKKWISDINKRKYK